MTASEVIRLAGVAGNNLRGFDVEFPLHRFTVVTGKSGSGKSSLVFDTLYGEAYRRYVESLSSFARQYMKAMPKPVLEGAHNLPAAIAVKQVKAGQSNRSTVGTMTEILDLLRIIFTHLSEVECCGEVVKKYSPKAVVSDLLEHYAGDKVLVMARLPVYEGLSSDNLKKQLFEQGFTRLYTNDKVEKIADVPAATLLKSAVVITRVTVSKEKEASLLEACELAMQLGQGELEIKTQSDLRRYSQQLKCDHCGTVYPEPTPQLFNFNSPLGACEECQGFGRVPVLDHQKIIPDLDGSLFDEGIAPWNFGQHRAYYAKAVASAKNIGIPASKAFREYTKKEMDWLYEGDSGRKASRYKGIRGYFEWLATKKYKSHLRIHSARFHRYETCPKCHGERYRDILSSYKVGGYTLAESCRLTLAHLAEWIGSLTPQLSNGANSKERASGLQDAFEEIIQRLYYLNKIGVHYLSLNRTTSTLSGGEIQRINMARSLGSRLTETLFCLDEPSSGLHPRDSQNLLEIIYELRDQGNTVVVVEHERGLIQGADCQIQIGPEAGSEGGQLVYQGSPKSDKSKPLEWEKVNPSSPAGKKRWLTIKKVSTHNLKEVTAKILWNGINVVCGVSGSGKTSLIRHSFFPLLQAELDPKSRVELAKECGELVPDKLIQSIEDVLLVGQEGLGRSTRSNIATYLGIFGEIRKLLAQTPVAKTLKLTPGHFSFNVKGGRCETCKGLGVVKEDLSFLGEMDVICPDCQGLRFTEKVLSIQYRGKNLIEILDLTIDEARDFFMDNKMIKRVLDLVHEVSMGYMTLGQNTSSFSGGEAQRLKILSFLIENKQAGPQVFIFDEPTTGLSDTDVYQLLKQFVLLKEQGHTVVVVEHHHGVIRAADWVLEIGPEAAEAGGELVFSGTSGELQDSQTLTSEYLKRLAS